MFQPILWEPSSAYARYGFGLCEHWQDDAEGEREMMQSVRVLAMHYTEVDASDDEVGRRGAGAVDGGASSWGAMRRRGMLARKSTGKP
jgi:hypothetical protein